MLAVVLLLYRKVRLRKRQIEEAYSSKQSELEQARVELSVLEQNSQTDKEKVSLLLQQSVELETLISEKRKRINTLEEELAEYQRGHYGTMMPSEHRLRDFPVYKHFEAYKTKGVPTDQDWADLEEMLKNIMPDFWRFLELHSDLSQTERQVCMLTSLHIKPKEVSNILGKSSSSVSKIRLQLLKKCFDVEGKPQEFDRRIFNLC